MSHSCEHEHEHGHGHGDHGHDHSPPLATNEVQSLYKYINTPQVRCLNAVGCGSNDLSSCFIKSQDDKYDISKYLESDADCQLILHIPFTGVCRLFSCIFRFGRNSSGGIGSPKNVKLFKNFTKNIDFDNLSEAKPQHELENPENVGIDVDGAAGATSVENDAGFVEHHLPRQHFQNVESLTLFVENNWTGDEDDLTRCFYVELRGEFANHKRSDDEFPLMAVYEAAPNPLDHQKVESELGGTTLGM
ncbi:LAME_0A05050g1_1 [Lachancea meyersii CBS 8951]|uniref:LAME_0A05050g1_1 n=1 Tax=Lachancea meyersii CBS 8951 TaxID=1266667 RepID=A0A1G4IQ41_9SACH|nr:LAME_0A05050g1_1 [Lachancea meyersii CBS 8951]